MKPEKEKWITEVLQSTDDIGRVEAEAALFAGVKARLKGQVRAVKNLPAQTVWLAAASLALLVVLNIAIISFNQKGNTGSTSQAGSNGYALNNSFQLY